MQQQIQGTQALNQADDPHVVLEVTVIWCNVQQVVRQLHVTTAYSKWVQPRSEKLQLG